MDCFIYVVKTKALITVISRSAPLFSNIQKRGFLMTWLSWLWEVCDYYSINPVDRSAQKTRVS